MSENKIFMITFHRAQSYGAFLQAFALQNCEVLRNYSPIYIDYYPERFRYRKYALEVNDNNLIKKIIKTPLVVGFKTRMHICIMRYVRKYLRLTQKTYYDPCELFTLGNEAEIFISGSDQIWDCRYDNIENVLPYYLNFTNRKKFSYASSCGEMQYNKNKNESCYETILEELKTYSEITVREQYSADDLNLCGFDTAQMMLDPTFLLSSTDWNKYLKHRSKTERYILVYGLYRNPILKEYAVKLSKRKNMKILNICDFLDYILGAKNILNVTPFRLLEFIRDAEEVVTDSFHGCALSINFEKNLHIFMPLTSKERIRNLIEIFGLENRVVTDHNVITTDMDYSNINQILRKERERSNCYLRRIVGDPDAK